MNKKNSFLLKSKKKNKLVLGFIVIYYCHFKKTLDIIMEMKKT